MDRQVIEDLLSGVSDPGVRRAFARVDRERFVLPEFRCQAWGDHPLPIGEGATISQPSLVARMTELLKVREGLHILEIGTGSGYQTAILAEMGAEVWTVEIDSYLARTARERLPQANIHFRCGDGRLGWPEAAPFDRIIATVAFQHLPPPLASQLSEDGILLAPIGPPEDVQALQLYRRRNDRLVSAPVGPVRFLSAHD